MADEKHAQSVDRCRLGRNAVKASMSFAPGPRTDWLFQCVVYSGGGTYVSSSYILSPESTSACGIRSPASPRHL